MAAQVPAELYDRETLVVRTRDMSGRWARPHNELRRLADAGLVRALAHGYWLIPPADRLTDPAWRPEIEAVALALAVADYGPDDTALMGISAARHHGAVPRALAGAVVAVPRQRPALATGYGTITFVQRDTARLDVEPAVTALVTGAVTTVEQTILDLADRPALGGLAAREVGQALSALALRARWAELLRQARNQHAHAGYVRARWVAARVLDEAPPPWPPRRPVDGAGLVAPAADDAAFGVAAPA